MKSCYLVMQFLDAIIDTSENIRLTARNILKLAKLPDMKLVNKGVDGVLKSLEMYPQVGILTYKNQLASDSIDRFPSSYFESHFLAVSL